MSHPTPPAECAHWSGRVFVALSVLASFGALYAFGLASDPETYQGEAACRAYVPSEDDYRQPADLPHNGRIFALRRSLEERGFALNGGADVNEDPLAAIRGTYSFISPDDDLQQLEWRLMASRAPTCLPSSFVRLHQPEQRFSPRQMTRLSQEWDKAAEWLPANVIAGGRELLSKVTTLWQLDRESSPGAALPPVADVAEVELLERQWQSLPRDVERYRLKLRQVMDDYQLDAELCDHARSPGRLPSCEVTLHFRWLRSVASAK